MINDSCMIGDLRTTTPIGVTQFHFSLFTLHFSFFTFHSSLFTFHSSLFILHSSLFILHFSLFTQNVFHRLMSAMQNTPTTMITFRRFLRKA